MRGLCLVKQEKRIEEEEVNRRGKILMKRERKRGKKEKVGGAKEIGRE
jgi:hypothetical protein